METLKRWTATAIGSAMLTTLTAQQLTIEPLALPDFNKRYRQAEVGALATYSRTIEFAGYLWEVKTSYGGRVGPGPNYFSDSVNNAWVDTQGRLHLKITRDNKKRYFCAEVVSAQPLGYGLYRWYLDTPVDTLDRNVVLGLFTWSDTSPFYNGELDIEFSRWGMSNFPNAQYVVQPFDAPLHMLRFTIPAGLPQTTHSLFWESTAVSFESLAGHDLASSPVLQDWSFVQSAEVPPFTNENARMNLWLYQGLRPSNGLAVEVIIRDFEFTPLP